MMAYMIRKLDDGGYIVLRLPDTQEFANIFWPPTFASGDIGECLAYIRDKMDPKPILMAVGDDPAPGAINYRG